MVIAGPTAVGKTALAIELARHYNTVIVSADSRQFYREMNIGTAKPSGAQLNAVPHYFINTKHIGELFGAGHFEKEAMALLDRLFEEHELVLMVGGSGLYLDAVLNGVDDFAEVPLETREVLNQLFAEKGLMFLQERLKEQDPEYAQKVDLHNPQRVIRALEVIQHTGKTYSSFLNQQKTQRSFTPIKLLINAPREELYARINQRVDDMMAAGLLDEVKHLLPFKSYNALKTVGYQELFDYLDGQSTLEVAVDKIKQHTRNYAKRQLTWFRNKDQFEEFGAGDAEIIIAYLDIIRAHG